MTEHDGLITRDDLAAYQAKERPPVKTTFRGHDVYGIGPPASGGSSSSRCSTSWNATT